MKVKLTFLRESGPAVDIVVTADSTATVGDVARAIDANDPFVAVRARHDEGELTLEVAPPTADSRVPLRSDLLFSEAPIGSGFIAALRVLPHDETDQRTGAHSVAAVVRIHNGPDAGREHPLPTGHSIIGRTADADVVLRDQLVSKRHARVEVGPSGTEVIDLNSANGILVDGGLVPRLKVVPGQRFVLGDTEISITPIGSQNDAHDDLVLERGGSLMFNRSPRVEARYPGKEYPQPAMPSEPNQRLFPWPMVVAPAILGLMMFFLQGNPTSLLLILGSPMMMFGNFIGQRNQSGQQLKREVDTFESQIETLHDTLAEQQELERASRHSEAPAVAVVYENAMRLGPLLWTRRPEHWNFLQLRLGVGTAQSRNSIAEAEDDRSIPKYRRQLDRVREHFATIDDVPLVESLMSSGAIGIAGSREDVGDIVRGLGVQLFGLHAPTEVVTGALVGPGWANELEWLKWLPHSSSPASPIGDVALADSQSAGTAVLNAVEELILRQPEEDRQDSRRGPLHAADSSMRQGTRVGESESEFIAAGVAMVLVVSSDAPVDRPRLTQIIERGPGVGVCTIFVGPTVESLPAACRTFIDASEGLAHARVGYVRSGESYQDVAVEGVSKAYAEVFAKRLAPVVDAGSVEADSSDLPGTVSLLNLVGTEMASLPSTVIERWRQNMSIIDRSGAALPRLKRAGTLKAFIGQASPDAMTLDLRTQGPHALVGGTTGSGKSEFLQAWVLGMASEYSPDRVTFLFVDYKGGSAFADCVELPHCVGLVTDLSPHLVRRALTSLRAELHYREHLFNRKKAKDLLELEKRRDPETPPALVLVIDEFAALAGEVPEFVDGVVDIAQRGRSLGIHLIMATQRPAGVIKDNLRANTNLRVALRMADHSDSKDVVDDPIAGTFDPSIPGRGIAKTGPGRLVPFQSAYSGGWTSGAVAEAEVRVAELRFGSVILWETESDADSDSHDDDLGPNDQKRIVKTMVRARADAAIPLPRRPWLDDLPQLIDLSDVPVGNDSQIVLGIADIPERQLQEAVHFVPDRDGSLVIYGTSGSGKSAALRTIATSAGMRPDLGAAAVYGLDFGSGALRSLEVLPQVGSVIAGDDAERVQRLLRMIGDELDRRGDALSAANASTLSEYRSITGDRMPRVIVLLDGFAQFRAEWDANAQRAPFYNTFLRILGEGRPLGVHAVITADRSGAIPAAVSATVSRRVVLRMSEESGYQLLGVPKDVLDESSVPGRAIVDGQEAQLAVIGGTSNVAEQSKALESLARQLLQQGAIVVPPVGALPTELDVDSLPAEAGGEPVIGVSEETLEPRGFEPVGAFVVTGPPQSGKTNAMKALVQSVVRFDPEVKLFHIAGRRAQLTDFAPWVRSATAIDDVKELAAELAELIPDESIPGRLMVAVENVTQFVDSDAERPLKALFQAVNRSDHFLIGDADVANISGAFGLVADFKAGRRGIDLMPDAFDGDALFKVPFPRVKRSDFPSGRGIFVQNGRYVTVQLPLVTSERVVVTGMGTATH